MCPKPLAGPFLSPQVPLDRDIFIRWPSPGPSATDVSRPQSTLNNMLRWAHDNRHFLITLCHGPSSMLAADIGKPEGSKDICDGYEIAAFPDSLDNDANVDIG